MEMVQGFTDEAIKNVADDVFEVKQYVDGLGDFIKTCDTPMTIAIQGDWGSGKTSMMNMILENIKSDVVPVKFNTWQYSQFNMGDQLTITFLSELIQQMEYKNKEFTKSFQQSLATIAKGVWRFSKEAAVITVEHTVGEGASGIVKDVLNAGQEVDTDMSSAIRQLKKEFQTCVDNTNKENGKDRVVFFVDDLDRLNPGKAVELLEVLKLFLDCKNCVFVLAIDYAVVSQGVKEKYGNLIGEEKGKSFFDKIIQVPFKMPVAHYNVSVYVEKMISNLGITVEEKNKEAELKQYVNLIQNSIGCNPRAMKRLFNAFSLLNKIYKNQMEEDAWNKKMLFAILCMQQSFDELYNYIVANCEDIKDGNLLNDLSITENYFKEEHGISISKDMNISDEILVNKMATFMKTFTAVIDKDGKNGIDENEIDDFMKVLGFSTVTSASTDVSTQDEDAGYFRWATRKVVKDVNQKLKKTISLTLYQTRKDYEVWKKYYACGYKYFTIEDGSEYSAEYIIIPNLEDRSVVIQTYIAARKNMQESVFKEMFENLSKANMSRTYTYNSEEMRYVYNTEPIVAENGEVDLEKIEECTLNECKQLLDTFKLV